MPFLQDIGASDELLERPILGVFGLVRDNLERVMLANMGWALQLLPALAALAFPQIPLVLRVVLLLYTLTALAPATALLYVWMARVCQGELLGMDMLKEDLRAHFWPGLQRLAPLFGVLGLSYLSIIGLGFVHLLVLDTLARFLFLLLLVCALYWGPLYVEFPREGMVSLLRRSVHLVWRYPGPTLLTGLVVGLVALFGLATVITLFVLVPAVLVLLQTRRCLELLERERQRQNRGRRQVL